MARKKTYSPQEKKEYLEQKLESLQKTLEEGVKNFKASPERYKALLEMQALMPTYSFRNLLVAKAQYESALFLAPFKRWKELGRHVKKGERSIRIFAPRFKKEISEEEVDGKTVEVEKQKIQGFVTVPVFDVSQTEGEPLPYDDFQLTLEGDSPEARRIIEAIHEIADLPIEYTDTGVANGLYYPYQHRIEIHRDRSINQQAKTLVHEYVHSIAHGEELAGESSKKEKEVVAEGTAFVVCRYLGLVTSDYSFDYVRGWSGDDKDAVLKYGDQISTLSRAIIRQIDAAQQKKIDVSGAVS